MEITLMMKEIPEEKWILREKLGRMESEEDPAPP